MVVCVGGLAGCGNPSAEKPAPQLSAGVGSFIADIPVPQGFALNDIKSRNYSYQTARFLDHYYEGKQDLMAVRNFYMSQLPTQKWEITADTLSDGAYTIRCHKAHERCDITISRANRDKLFSGVQIHVVLEPQQTSTGNAPAQQPRNSEGQPPPEP